MSQIVPLEQAKVAARIQTVGPKHTQTNTNHDRQQPITITSSYGFMKLTGARKVKEECLGKIKEGKDLPPTSEECKERRGKKTVKELRKHPPFLDIKGNQMKRGSKGKSCAKEILAAAFKSCQV